jgi:hypothetical protein
MGNTPGKDLTTEWDHPFQETAAFVHRHIVPFYLLTDETLSLDRTGVLFQAAGYKFILTAAHGLRNYNPKVTIPCFAHSKSNQYPIPLSEATFYRTESDSEKGVRDIAAIRLTETQIEELPDWFQFLTIRDLGHESKVDEGFFLIMGFPSHEEWYRKEKWSNPTPLPYVSMPITPDSSSLFDHNVHLAMTFHKNSLAWGAEVGTREEVALPSIKGMSGCGIWKVIQPGIGIKEWDVTNVRLVGIQHRCKHDAYILGTQIRWVLHRLVDDFPDIQSVLRISYKPGY